MNAPVFFRILIYWVLCWKVKLSISSVCFYSYIFVKQCQSFQVIILSAVEVAGYNSRAPLHNHLWRDSATRFFMIHYSPTLDNHILSFQIRRYNQLKVHPCTGLNYNANNFRFMYSHKELAKPHSLNNQPYIWKTELQYSGRIYIENYNTTWYMRLFICQHREQYSS